MSLLLRRRDLLSDSNQILELPLTSSYWGLSTTSRTSFATESDGSPYVQYTNTSTSGLMENLIYTNNEINFSKYKKCIVTFTLNSISSTSSSPGSSYLGLAAGRRLASGSLVTPLATPTERVSTDWSLRGYMIGIYRDASGTYAMLDVGEHTIEYDLSEINDTSGYRLAMYLTSYQYKADYKITSVILMG